MKLNYELLNKLNKGYRDYYIWIFKNLHDLKDEQKPVAIKMLKRKKYII